MTIRTNKEIKVKIRDYSERICKVGYFSVKTSKKRKPEDIITIKNVGSINFHIHDIIIASPVEGIFTLYDNLKEMEKIRLSITFTYGLFGFGHSLQFVKGTTMCTLFPSLDISDFKTTKVEDIMECKKKEGKRFKVELEKEDLSIYLLKK